MRAVYQATAKLCQTYGVETTPSLDEKSGGRIRYCLTEPSPYGVFIAGRKVAGFALRRFPQTWLVQGSVLVQPLPSVITHVLPWDVRCQLALRAVALAEIAGMPVNINDFARRWAEHWPTWWEEALRDQWALAN